MIEELSVRNFALIDSLNLSLEGGFSVLTGETGAGKSIIVGTLSFLLGAKADVDVIRSGSDEASVSAVISVNAKNRDALEWLRQRDIGLEDSRLVVRRILKSSGRSSIYIQNLPATRNDLAEFMGFLLDLHGQHTHESLMRKETHRVYLDRFSGIEDEVAAFNRVFMELAEKRKTLDALDRSVKDREQRLELLNYALEEITKAAPKKGEIKELEAETQRLGDFEKLSTCVNTASSAFFEGDDSLLTLARRLRNALDNAVAIDNSLLPVQKRMEDLYFEAEDLAEEFRTYRDNLSYDPERLEEAEERLSLLYKLKKKYRPARGGRSAGSSSGTAVEITSAMTAGEDAGLFSSDEDGILAYKAEAESEIEALSGAEENQDTLKAEISRLEKDLVSRAQALSAKRSEGAKRLGAGISDILSRLGMPKAAFSARVSAKSKEKSFTCGPWGADDVEFLFSANTGEPLKELSRIASGGELSRVMLAIKTILCGIDGNAGGDQDDCAGPSAGVHPLPNTGQDTGAGQDASAETLIFDEVDAGIGGEVALSVGEYLARIGKRKQIFCVTHLASIAARADNHLKVEKRVIAGGSKDNAGGGGGTERTVTGVSVLSAQERRQEIARMLSGDSGKIALAHADELLAKYQEKEGKLPG